MHRVELAQLNIGRTVAPLDDPRMDGFVTRLGEINGLAERSPGYVWRLTDELGADATGVRAYDDPLVIVNLTVWADIDPLFDFAYRSTHIELLRARRDWFVPLDGPTLVLWWVRADVRPTVEQAVARLDHLTAHGPSAHAFTMKARFDPDWAELDRKPAVGSPA
jgi:hypothetical protein